MCSLQMIHEEESMSGSAVILPRYQSCSYLDLEFVKASPQPEVAVPPPFDPPDVDAGNSEGTYSADRIRKYDWFEADGYPNGAL